MMHRLSILIFIMSITIGAAAQSATNLFTISGVLVADSIGEGIPYATIKVSRKDTPAKALKMFVSDLDGNFKEKISGTGEFILTATSVGKQTLTHEFKAAAGEKSINLGNLLMKNSSTTLQELEVKAQKPLVKADLDKIQYSVEDDPDSKTSTVIEMLRKVPLVTVDGEDKISVNGSSNFKVYINGKPNNMITKSPSEVLKSMPASSIKHIEVITDPGVKEDAEGVGGILNIVTTQGTSMKGYTATLTGNVGNRGYGGSLYAMVSAGKFTMSARYNYNHRTNPDVTSLSQRRTTGTPSESSYDLNSMGNTKYRQNFQWGNLEASYEIDTLRLITASFGLWGGSNTNDGTTVNNAFVPATTTSLYNYNRINNTKSSWYSIDGSLDYQRLFSMKDRMLTFSYRISTNPDTSNDYSIYDIDKNYNQNWEQFLQSLYNQRSDGKQGTTENTLQIDYTTPFNKIHKIEVGAKYILRNNHSENDRYVANSAGEYLFDNVNSMHYRHQNNILGTYAGYSFSAKKFSGKAGVRYEHTSQDVSYKLGRGEDFSTTFNDVLPAASIGYKLTQMSNLRFAYNMRIHRPGIWSLNPYLNNSNPIALSQGNPNLNSEKNHSFNLSYGNFTQKFNINITARYSFTNNGIENVTTLMKDSDIPGIVNPTGKEVAYTTYDNFGKNQRAGLSAYVNWNASKDTRIYANINGNYDKLEGSNNQKNDGFSFSAYGGAQQSFNHDWQIGINLFGRSRSVSLQGNNSGFFSYGMNVNKSFLKKRLTLSLSASDFFNDKLTFTENTWGEGFTIYNETKVQRMRINFSVSYRLGELKAAVKKAARTINNDDVKSNESNNTQGN